MPRGEQVHCSIYIPAVVHEVPGENVIILWCRCRRTGFRCHSVLIVYATFDDVRRRCPDLFTTNLGPSLAANRDVQPLMERSEHTERLK